MNKERIKSFVLVFLVMMNLFLGIRIFTDKKLWPSGYNFFLSMGDFNLFDNEVSQKTQAWAPQQIIINTGDQTSRISVGSNEEMFIKINEVTKDMLTSAFRAEAKYVSFAPKAQWVSALNRQSVCIRYSVPYDSELLGESFGVPSTALSEFVPTTSLIVISTDSRVYFENYETGEFYRVEISSDSSELGKLINTLKRLNASNTAIINYAVDLKFDEAFGGQKAVLAPAVPVYSTPVTAPVLAAFNPIISGENAINKDVLDKILSVFKINTNAVRRYPEVDGTIVFVENDGILKVSPKGIIKYQSTAANGFELSSGNAYAETVTALAEFTDRVSSIIPGGQDLYLSTPLTSSSDIVNFDYSANGIPVVLDYEGHNHAVTAEIRNGAIYSYTHVIRQYSLGEEEILVPAFIDALDSAILKYSEDMNNIKIQKMQLSYNDDGLNSLYTGEWITEVKSIEIKEE